MKKLIWMSIILTVLLVPARQLEPRTPLDIPDLSFLGESSFAQSVKVLLIKMYQLDQKRAEYEREVRDYLAKTRAKLDEIRNDNDVYSGYAVYNIITSGFLLDLSRRSLRSEMDAWMLEFQLTEDVVKRLFTPPSWRQWFSRQYAALIFEAGTMPADVHLDPVEVFEKAAEIEESALVFDEKLYATLDSMSTAIKRSMVKKNLDESERIKSGDEPTMLEQRMVDKELESKAWAVSTIDDYLEKVRKNQADKLEAVSILKAKAEAAISSTRFKKIAGFIEANFAPSISSWSFYASEIFKPLRVAHLIPHFGDRFKELSLKNEKFSEKTIYAPFIRMFVPIRAFGVTIAYLIFLFLVGRELWRNVFGQSFRATLQILTHKWLLLILIITYPIWMILINDFITLGIDIVGDKVGGEVKIMMFYDKIAAVLSEPSAEKTFWPPGAGGLMWYIKMFPVAIAKLVVDAIYFAVLLLAVTVVTLVLVVFAVFIFCIQAVVFVTGMIALTYAMLRQGSAWEWFKKFLATRLWEISFLIILALMVLMTSFSLDTVAEIFGSFKTTGIMTALIALAAFVFVILSKEIFHITEFMLPAGSSSLGGPFGRVTSQVSNMFKVKRG